MERDPSFGPPIQRWEKVSIVGLIVGLVVIVLRTFVGFAVIIRLIH